jgi:hypothetical protein
MEMCEDYALNFGDIELAVASRQRTVSHFPFQQGIFDQGNMTDVSQLSYFSVSPIQGKSEGMPFWHN